MLKPKLIFTLLLFSCLVSAQSKDTKYNKALADSLGADEYGMKSYVLVILKTGANNSENEKTVDSLFHGHLNNIGRLASQGKLVLAGPFLKNNDENYRGIFILNAKTIDEANALLITDPAIKAKLLEPLLFPWYGTAALPLIPKLHEEVQKIKIE
jgi:uncharacterized protein YciI